MLEPCTGSCIALHRTHEGAGPVVEEEGLLSDCGHAVSVRSCHRCDVSLGWPEVGLGSAESYTANGEQGSREVGSVRGHHVAQALVGEAGQLRADEGQPSDPDAS